MRPKQSVFVRFSASRTIVLGVVALLGCGPWASATAQGPGADKTVAKAPVDQKEKPGFGRFVSFQDGTLIVESNSGSLLAWSKIAENTKTLKYDPASNDYKPVEGTLAALQGVKAGTYMMVGNGRAFIRIGARHDQVVGTFISFKNERLLTLGKDLPESFTKRYGNNLLYNKFRDDVPVYESVDGGDFKLIGTANKVLAEIKEGTVLNVHGEGDDNITRIEIGTPKKK